jgi:hypothetical protein
MQDPDLLEAWRCLKRLERILADNPGGRRQKAVLAAVRESCAAASKAVHDLVFNDRLAELETYATDLFSPSAHHKWSRQEVTGAEWLRFQIYRTCNALDTRLRMLRQAREARRLEVPR